MKNGIKLTPLERKIMELRIAGCTFRQITLLQGCALSTALNVSSIAARKLGLASTRDPREVKAALHAYDHPRPVRPMDDPAFQ